jgi:hypothetical protein
MGKGQRFGVGRGRAPEQLGTEGRGGAADRQLAQVFAFGGALAGFALLGLIWMTVSVVSDEPPRTDGGASELRQLDQRPAAAAEAEPGATPLQRCASMAESLATPVRSAGPAMDQWELHVGAMNKLVAGAISLPQATAFWNQTRVGAKKLIADFHRADRISARQAVSCHWRHFEHHAPPALRACAREVAADAKALGAARTAVATWEMHVHDMEALRSGKLSPAAATSMWISMWKEGVHQVRVFHAAERSARRQGGCRAA